jgi:hypothetical protein
MDNPRHRRKILQIMAAGGLLGFALGNALDLWFSPFLSGVLGVFWMMPVAALIAFAWSWASARLPHPELSVGLVVFGALCLLPVWWAPESKFLPDLYNDTCFPPGFQRASFDRLRLGMSPAEVEAITGAPLLRRPPRTWGYVLPADVDLVWVYSTDNCSQTRDSAWRSYEVGFRNGAVAILSTAWRFD